MTIQSERNSGALALDSVISITSASSFAEPAARPLDQFFTPKVLADHLAGLATVEVESVADFAAGCGNLLASAASRWPEASLYANDVDGSTIAIAKSALARLEYDQLDFLSREFYEKYTKRYKKTWSLVLLNPPFSQRDTLTHSPSGSYSSIKCSRAMAFVMTAVNYLAERGQLLAILPTSTLRNNLDQQAREILQRDFDVEVVLAPQYGFFSNADVSVYVLRITKKLIGAAAPVIRKATSGTNWVIARGTISVPRRERVPSPTAGWVHTTGLVDGQIAHRYSFVAGSRGKKVPRGSVLLPRVGRFGPDKIAIVTSKDGEFISDCLLAITRRGVTSKTLQRFMTNNFTELSELYAGTGAPYITMSHLLTFLNRLRS